MTEICGYEEPHPVKYNNFFWDLLLRFQRFVIIVSSLFVVASIGATVVLRYIFKTDLYGLEEIVVIFAFWLYFMGGHTEAIPVLTSPQTSSPLPCPKAG